MNLAIQKTLSLLFICEESKQARGLTSLFKKCFKDVYYVSNTKQAFDIYESDNFDLVIIDFFLEGSVEFIKKIRQYEQRKPLILLSKKLRREDLLDLLTLSINGLISKSSTNSVILKDLNIIMQTFSGLMETISQARYCYGTKTLLYPDKTVNLTHHEIQLLELLLSRRSYLVYYAEIEYEIWQNKQMSADALKTLVKKLRKKLPEGTLINIPSEGYKLL